ncbi:MAG TPA: SDR family NAD(P)-dependent oxidoreductase [Anaerolineales bacterium]
MARMTIQDKVAIITGASSGIGRATALALAREGANVVLASRNLSALKDAAREVKALGRQALVIPCDVPQAEQVQSMVAETVERLGRVDILFANAGEYVRAPIKDMPISLLEQSMAVNFYGSVNAVQAVLPHMLAQSSGHIVLMNSMIALRPFPPDTPYAAAKSALKGFGENLRQELIGTGVYSTLVYPGRVDTPFIEDLKMPWLAAKISPEVVANSILKAIKHRKHKVIVAPFQSKMLYYLNFVLPVSVSDRLAYMLKLRGWESG